jgi:hypothetical protein
LTTGLALQASDFGGGSAGGRSTSRPEARGAAGDVNPTPLVEARGAFTGGSPQSGGQIQLLLQ